MLCWGSVTSLAPCQMDRDATPTQLLGAESLALVMCTFQLLLHLPGIWHKEYMPLYNGLLLQTYHVILINICSSCINFQHAALLISVLLVLTVLPCGTPSSLSNGQRHYTSTTVRSTVTYTCNTGYRMTAGSSRRTCQFGGHWSGSHPTCSSEFTLVTFIIFATWLTRG